jgi:hypothetical protein
MIGNSRVLVRLEDEAWWINPNSASPALLEALMRATGSDPESARRQAGAIGEWLARRPRPGLKTRSWRTIRRQGSITDRGRTARDPRRARPGARHDPGYPCRDPTPSDVVRTLTAECNHLRSDRRSGSRRIRPGRGGSFREPAAARCTDHADHRNRVRPEQRQSNPIRDRPSWRRASPRLDVLAWRNGF